MIEVSFVFAFPGWEVLYYFKGGRFETAPVVAWAVQDTVTADGPFVRVVPVTADLAWSSDDDRPLCTPDGDVTCGELERWDSVWEWLADMQRREREEPDKLPTERSQAQPPGEGTAPIVLNNFRKKFEANPPDA